jgi:gas vesicle protein
VNVNKKRTFKLLLIQIKKIMSNNTGNTILALLTGAAIGVGMGILFAPDKGSKTREKIKDSFDEAKDDLKQKLEEVSTQLKNNVTNTKNNFEDSYEDMVSNMSHKTEDVISFLETKLMELKKENAKLQK